MGFIIFIQSPDSEPREMRLVEGETYLGRDPANTLVLEGRGVSRRHAKFVCGGERLTLIDLGSTYGTRVNDVTTLRRELVEADEVTIGVHKLKVKHIDDSPAAQLPTLEATIPSAAPYFSEEVTQAPGGGGGGGGAGGGFDVHQRKTLQMNRSAIQFVLDNPTDSGQAVKVLARHDSDLMKAVKRFGTGSGPILQGQKTQPPRGTDYQALVLMYRVSELLVAARDLEDFLNQMADLVLEEVRADTVVLLSLGPGNELVPQVIRHRGTLTAGEVPISRGIIDRVLHDRVAVMSNDVGHDERIKSGQSVMLYKIRAVVALPLTVRGELRGVLYLSRSGLQTFSSADADLMSALVALVASGLERAELKERVDDEKQRRRALERFHPPEVVERLDDAQAGEASLQEHQATVLVCELSDFASLVSRVPPRQLATVLHEYYELLYERVFSNGGSLVKLHDGWACALFGAPHSPDRDAVWAVETAKELADEFESIAVLWPGSQTITLRCALDSGNVVSGVLGSAERLEYVALGLPITAAAELARRAEGGILLSERTWAELPQARYRVTEVSPASPSGSAAALRVFSLQP